MGDYKIKLPDPKHHALFEVGMMLMIVSVNRNTGELELAQAFTNKPSEFKGIYWDKTLMSRLAELEKK